MGLEDFEKIQPQLLALCGTAITHPAVTPARRPDRVFLVSTASLTPPVRDRIEKFNLGNSGLSMPPIEPIEREQLVSRFLSAHGQYLPEDPAEIRKLLELYYDDGVGTFPIGDFAKFAEALLPLHPSVVSLPAYKRAAASATLLTAYASAPWERRENHLAVAQAWLTLCIELLHLVAANDLEFESIQTSYEIAVERGRMALASLCAEVYEAQDLVVPDLAEGIVYPMRALLVGGYLAAYLISEAQLGDTRVVRDQVHAILTRELKYLSVTGETDVPLLFTYACALEATGEMPLAERQVYSMAQLLSRANQPKSKLALADPYHSAEDLMMRMLGADDMIGREDFGGQAYTLHILVDWLTRRWLRQHLSWIWPDITRITFHEFAPSQPARYLRFDDPEGEVSVWSAAAPASWAGQLAQAEAFDPKKLPPVLWQRKEILPYLPLLFRHRFTSVIGKAVDRICAGHCQSGEVPVANQEP